MAWLYVPGLAESNSDSGSLLATDTEPFVMSRGKPMQRPSLERAWKTKPWMSRLSGLTLEPSTAARGVAKWILSLPDTHANRSALPADSVEPTIPDICGLMYAESLKRLNLDGSSARTCQDTLNLGSETLYSRSSKDSDTPWSTTHLARLKLARLIGVSGCSSWPTIVMHDGRRPCGGIGSTQGVSLSRDVAQWATPRADQSAGSKNVEWEPGKKPRVDGKPITTALTDQVSLFGRPPQTTPMLGDTCSTDGPNSRRLWRTPNVGDIIAEGCGIAKTGQNHLPQQLGGKKRLNPLFVEWLMNFPSGWSDVNRATSTVIDGMSSTQMDATGTSVLAKKDCDSVSNITTGCKPTPCSTGLTDFAPLETPLSLWLQRWRSYIYGIASMLPPTIVPEVEE